MSEIKLVQVEFGHQNERKLVWVEASWNLTPGMRVDFEEEGPIWNVLKVYDTKISAGSIYSKWGLNLPKTFRTER